MIKRRTAHTGFGFISVVLLAALGWQALQMHRAEQLNSMLESIPDSLQSIDAYVPGSTLQEHPSVQLAIGSALANGGNLEEAERMLNEIISSDTDSQAVTSAQYNLANAYLRKALATGTQTTSQTLPMVELAKQRYRDLLHQIPEHWDARYNLERALQMAPEGTERDDEGRNEPLKSVNVIVPGFEKKDLP